MAERGIPTATLKSFGSDPRTGITCWHSTKADGSSIRYSSHKTKFTPYWCKRHRWGTSEPCPSCADERAHGIVSPRPKSWPKVHGRLS